jgi:hypothetical protein
LSIENGDFITVFVPVNGRTMADSPRKQPPLNCSLSQKTTVVETYEV